MGKSSKKAVVLLSGGLDSTTVLAMAVQDGCQCTALSFDYAQRHRSELIAAQNISNSYEHVDHRILTLDTQLFAGSALTDNDISLPSEPAEGIPVTYVPARNTVFLANALALAEVIGAQDIFIGVNALDYSGYPDCRPAYIDAFQAMANLATRDAVEVRPVNIRTPLITLSKAEIISKGMELGVDYSLTVSCYDADDRGMACGECESCYLRKKGFVESGFDDPTRYRDP